MNKQQITQEEFDKKVEEILKSDWYYPELCDKAYFKRLRENYEESAHRTDEELHDYYNDGAKYSTTWDHIGDAYNEYEPLADRFYEALDLIKELKEENKKLLEAKQDKPEGEE